MKTGNNWKNRTELQRDILIARWAKIAEEHCFSYAIRSENTPFGEPIVHVFELAIEWTNQHGDIGIDWFPITSTEELYLAMGY